MGIGLFILTLLIGNGFIARDKAVTREMLGHDFLAFYTAGSFVRDGRYRELYNLESVKQFEQATSATAGLEVGKTFGPWWNPPFYAWVFRPLASLPYPAALDVWRGISIAAGILAIGLLTAMVARLYRAEFAARTMGGTPILLLPAATRLQDWQTWLLVPLLILISYPLIQAISHGQNTFTSLLILSATIALWRGEKKWFAGVVGGLLFYKPQLGAVVAGVMILDLGIPALLGLALTGVTLLLITLSAMPGALGDFLHQLPINVRWMQIENVYLWERHVTLKAFWRLLLQGREPGEPWALTTALTYISLAAAGGLLARSIFLNRFTANDEDRPVRRDRLIAATVAGMPLLMPFYFDYDLLLLAVPAVLYAKERAERPDLFRPSDTWLTRAWVALFLWLFINPGLAFRTNVNGSVLLLCAVSTLLTLRAGRSLVDEEAGEESIPLRQDAEPRQSLAA